MAVLDFLLRRIAYLVLVLLALSILVFAILQLIPGDPALTVAGVGASAADIETIRRHLGFDQPVPLQFLRWAISLAHGDWGTSIVSHEPVLPLLIARFQMTLLLACASILLATVGGVALGIGAALRANRAGDLLLSVLALLGVSAPIFWTALILQLVFAVELRALPLAGTGGLDHLVLPTLALAGNSVGLIMRMTRASMIEVLRQDYIRTAVAKGLSPWAVVGRHALRNASIPILTVVGVQFAYLLGGAILVETVFVWPGIGKLLADAVFRRDLPVVQGSILFIGLFFVLVNTLVDVAYAVADPRVRTP